MPNKIDDDRIRVSVMVTKDDFETIDDAARKMQMSTSMLFKEAIFRVAEEIASTGGLTIQQQARSKPEPKKPTKKSKAAKKTDKKPSENPFRRRFVFIADRDGVEAINDYAERLGVPASFLIREGVAKVVRELKESRAFSLRRPIDVSANEGLRRD
jgi:hypothetical protein